MSVDIETKAAMSDLLYTFQKFKEANDERLADIERKGSTDPVLQDKVDRLDKAVCEQKSAIERMTTLLSRPALEQGGGAVMSEAKSAFDAYVRSGSLAAPSLKAIAASDSSGGIIAPDEVGRMIDHGLRQISPIRQIATVRQIAGNAYRKPVASSAFGTGWAAETGTRAQTTTPTLQALDFPAMELFASPATTQALLDDAVLDVAQWLADEVQMEFALQESKSFVSGDGTNKPRGLLDYPTADDASRPFGSLGTVSSGGAAVTGDDLIDLVYTLTQGYRGNGRFLMNRQTASTIRKLKDGDGNYLWTPGISAGQPATLLGYPVTESEDMPNIANGATPIAFGDFARGYLVVDRAGVQVLRDPYSAKPFALFYTTKRVGGGVQDFAAIKLLEMSA